MKSPGISGNEEQLKIGIIWSRLRHTLICFVLFTVDGVSKWLKAAS